MTEDQETNETLIDTEAMEAIRKFESGGMTFKPLTELDKPKLGGIKFPKNKNLSPSKGNNLKYSIKELRKAKELFLNLPDNEDLPPVDYFIEFLKTNPLKKRSLIPKGGNDCIMTPRELARKIVAHFRPSGYILEPCMGEGAFKDNLEDYAFEGKVDWCELSKGRDFLLTDFGEKRYTYIVTNPPFSKLRAFLKKSMELADNIVFLCPVNHILGLKARKRDIKEAGFFVREVCRVEKPVEWPSSGFEYAAILLTRQAGDCKFSEL